MEIKLRKREKTRRWPWVIVGILLLIGLWHFFANIYREEEKKLRVHLRETIKETFEFIDNYISEDDMVHITEGIRIIPNTELYDIAINEGIISKEMNVIDPMFYVSPTIGKVNLTRILDRETGKRNNVMNSIDTEPSPELMQVALMYRSEHSIEEPLFRTLLRVQNKIK